MKKYPLISTMLRNGVIAGVLGVVLMIGLYYIGRHPLMIAFFLDFRIVVMGVFIFFSLKEFRDTYQGGELYFWQGLPGAWVLIITYGLVASVLVYVFGSIEKRFVADWIVQHTNYLKTFSSEEIKQIGKENFERNLRESQTTNIGDLAVDYFFKSLLIGLPLSIVVPIFVRKQPNN